MSDRESAITGYEGTVADGVQGIAEQCLAAAPRSDDLVRLVTAVAQFAEATVADLALKQPPPRPLACAAGCHFCCITHVVDASPLEAVAIATHVERHFDFTAQARLLARLREWVTARLADDDAPPKRRPCPLLDDDNCCAVYALRPMVCRGFNSYDAGACERFKAGDGNAVIKGYVNQDRVHQATLAGLDGAVRAGGREGGPVDLCTALLRLLTDPEAGRRWLAGDAVFADARPAQDSSKD